MRKGLLGSIAALAAGAGSAWGQPAPAPVAPAGGAPAVRAADVVPASGWGPAPVIMPPVTVGPPGDPLGLGPTAGLGPPPGPMYPPPGPYGAPQFQPPPPPPGGALGALHGGAGDCGPGVPRFWFDGEYLLWFAKNQPIDFPLLTTSAPNQFGLIGASSTIQLVRSDPINYGAISGFRLTGGFYGDADRRFGAMVTGLYTEHKVNTQNFSTQLPGATSVGIPLLARPFIDTDTGLSSLVLTNAFAGVGTTTVSTSTQTWGVEGAAVWNVFRSAGASRWGSLDFFAGYKYLQFTEDLKIESFTTLGGIRVIPIIRPGPFGVPQQVGVRVVPITNVPVGGVAVGAPATVQITDRIVATNKFNGGVFGLHHEAHWGMWNLMTTARLGVGDMHQVLEIHGATAFADPLTGQTGSTYGGLFANSSNIGRFDKDTFALIPEFTVNVGVNVTRSISMFVGYNFLWMSRVIRPGPQINPFVDSSTIPFSSTFGQFGHTPAVPRLFVEDDFWLTGVNFGVSFRY